MKKGRKVGKTEERKIYIILCYNRLHGGVW